MILAMFYYTHFSVIIKHSHPNTNTFKVAALLNQGIKIYKILD